MTANDFRAVLAFLGLSQTAAARELGISARTMRWYCANNGAEPNRRLVYLALRGLAQIETGGLDL